MRPAKSVANIFPTVDRPCRAGRARAQMLLRRVVEIADP